MTKSMPPTLLSFWNLPTEQALHQLKSRPQGLSRQEAEQRIIDYGANRFQVILFC
jgi:Mg2+-importing ATPase